jgi:hypothetical protein
MMKNTDSRSADIVKRQGANALIAATIAFLNANDISKNLIVDSIRDYYSPRKPINSVRQYRKLARAYEHMGTVMSTWYSSSNFLDSECRPIPLTNRPGHRSVHALVRAARVPISTAVAIELMHRSPSIGIDSLGNLVAQRREFVLPDFAVPRAALVIERYLDTLHRNSVSHKRKSVLLLERNCHVPEVNLKTIAPILRDIKKRGAAYIDSVNGDVEVLRRTRSRGKDSGEMSVHIFAWTRLARPTKQIKDGSRKSSQQSRPA